MNKLYGMLVALVISGSIVAAQQVQDVITRPDGTQITVRIMVGDIVKQSGIDAIVNAANETLLGGAGVDGAIHEAAKDDERQIESDLDRACQALPQVRPGVRCPVGQVRVTPAFGKLKREQHNRYIIHAVGPTGHMHNKEQLLRDTYYNSLREACRLGVTTVAFPSISTGIYGYDVKEASQIALKTVREFITQYEGDMSLKEVRFVLWPDNFQVYSKVLNDRVAPRQQSWSSWLHRYKTSLALGTIAFVAACYWLFNNR